MPQGANPLASGQPRTWACGAIYALGQLNFLADKANQPYMAMADVCAAFGVGQSTAYAKARVITDALHTSRMDPAWMLKSLVDRNPLVWMAEVNGLLVDLTPLWCTDRQEWSELVALGASHDNSMGAPRGCGGGEAIVG